MKDIKERVKYTIEFYVTKKNNVWIVDSLNDEVREKIHGIYSY